MTGMLANWRLWFGLAAAPCAWLVQFFAGWFFGARICGSMSVSSVRITVGSIGLAAIACAAAGLLVGFGNLAAARSLDLPAEDRVEFMSLGAILVSSAFLVGTVWATLNAAFISGCGGMR